MIEQQQYTSYSTRNTIGSRIYTQRTQPISTKDTKTIKHEKKRVKIVQEKISFLDSSVGCKEDNSVSCFLYRLDQSNVLYK